MSVTIYEHRERNAPMSTTLASLRSTARSLLDRLAAIDAELRLRAELGRLDERTLRDIGLSRTDVDAEIRRLPRAFAGCQGRSRVRIPSPAPGLEPDLPRGARRRRSTASSASS
jgi:uncharacterized protein YjiS (DUF1127 family)